NRSNRNQTLTNAENARMNCPTVMRKNEDLYCIMLRRCREKNLAYSFIKSLLRVICVNQKQTAKRGNPQGFPLLPFCFFSCFIVFCRFPFPPPARYAWPDSPLLCCPPGGPDFFPAGGRFFPQSERP